MTVQGLENDYYLAGNDIWLLLHSILAPSVKLELQTTNLTTGQVLKKLTLYPSPLNEYQFNVSEVVRALFPEPSLTSYNNLQQILLEFNLFYKDAQIPNTALALTKFFVRGYREKNGTDEWYLSASEELIIKPWPVWHGISLPGFAQRIQGSQIVNYAPTNPRLVFPKSCDFKIVKFLNSKGGWQFYVFDYYQWKAKSKSKGIVSRTPNKLRESSFRGLGSAQEKQLELQAQTPFDLQDIILDLVGSSEVYLYDEKGNDEDSRWIRLDLESNSALKNNSDFTYENKLEFNIINSINTWL